MYVYVRTDRESAELAERLGLAEPKVDEAAQYESIVAKVLAQLERSFQDPNDPRLYERRKELVKLFGLVPPSFAKTLYERLHSEDPLGRLFRYRLATPTRKQLLGILLSAPSVGPQKPQVSPGPIQPGPPQPGPRPPWLPWPVWPWPWPRPRPRLLPPPPLQPSPPEPPRWRPPRLPLPDLSPKEILDRAKEVLEFLKRNNGDQSLIQKIENLLREAASIISLAGAVLGLYVFAKGRLVQTIAATGMVLPRIVRRFETSGMKDQLERILSELTDPKTTEPIKQEIRRTQPRAPKSALTECEETNPTFPICAEQLDIEPEKLVMNFLKNERIDPNDVLGINCRKFDSFGPGVIDDCNHAPGETWHCTVTTKVPGSSKPYVRVVSLFRCLCCRPDGWAAHNWRGPHWSAGG